MTDDRFRLSPNAVPQDEWSDMNRDLGVAVGVFAACVFILAVAFNEPDTKPIEDGGESIAITNNIPDAGTMNDEVPGVNDDFNFSDESGTGTGGIVIDDDTGVDNTDTSMPGLNEHLDVPDDRTTETDTGTDTGTIVVDTDSNESGTSEFDFNVPDDTSEDENLGEIIVVNETITNPNDSSSSSVDSSSVRPLGTGEDQLHTVARGEVLGTISQQYYGSTRYWKLIQDANNVYPEELQVGQRIIIPALPEDERTVARSTGARVANIELEAGQKTYTVKRGDNYYLIAQRELGDATRFKEIENLNGIDPYELDVGDVIVLPEARNVRRSSNPTPRAISGADTHVVASGETLGDISKIHYGTTTRWREIAAANGNLDPTRLKVGQKLQIPPDSRSGSSSSSSSSSSGATRVHSSSAGTREYTIKRGDTLGEIAQRELGTATRWREIQTMNPGLNPMRLVVGKKIQLPASSGAAARVTESASSNSITIDFNE